MGRLKRKEYEKEMAKLHVELVKLQEWVKHKGLKICIVCEGRDGAGKGGTIKAIAEHVSPVTEVRLSVLPASNATRSWSGSRPRAAHAEPCGCGGGVARACGGARGARWTRPIFLACRVSLVGRRTDVRPPYRRAPAPAALARPRRRGREYQLARKLERSWSSPPATLLALTGYGQLSHRKRALHAGFLGTSGETDRHRAPSGHPRRMRSPPMRTTPQQPQPTAR